MGRSAWLGVWWMACGGGSDEPLGEDTGEAPAALTPEAYGEPGPYTVGVAALSVAGPEGLTLDALVWYPSDEPAGAAYMYGGLVASGATEGLEPACASARPVLVFSHGLGGVSWQSGFFTEHFASHGYVVAAVDHKFGSLYDNDVSKIGELALRRPADLATTFDAVAQAYPGCVDAVAGYAVSGHSFGGYTALAAAGAEVNDPLRFGTTVDLSDDRVWASVPLAPWDGFGAITDGSSLIAVPTLVLTGREDATTPLRQVRGLYNPLTVAPRALGILEGGGHYTFSPSACLTTSGDGCGAGFLSEAEANPLINAAALAFVEGARGVVGAYDALPLDDDRVDWTAEWADDGGE